jgi:hypothetical protein
MTNQPNYQTPTPPDSTYGIWMTTEPVAAKSRRALWIVLAAFVVLLVAGFGAYLALGRSSGPTLTAAVEKCNDGRTDARLGDGGKTLIVNASGDAIKTIIDTQTEACILDYLETPESVRAHIEGTRALDGRQTDSWDGFTAAWTYHPDDGLDITIEAE